MKRAVMDAFRKLDPTACRQEPGNVRGGSRQRYDHLFFLRDLFTHAPDLLFTGQITAWLWFTILFANFAEAMAEGRGKAQAEALRKAKTETMARKLVRHPEERMRGLTPVVRVPEPSFVKGIWLYVRSAR